MRRGSGLLIGLACRASAGDTAPAPTSHSNESRAPGSRADDGPRSREAVERYRFVETLHDSAPPRFVLMRDRPRIQGVPNGAGKEDRSGDADEVRTLERRGDRRCRIGDRRDCGLRPRLIWTAAIFRASSASGIARGEGARVAMTFEVTGTRPRGSDRCPCRASR